jgi:NitT/TauT family transport system permease protein
MFSGRMAYGVVSLGLLLVLWQIVGSRINPIFMSTPTEVARATVAMWKTGELQAAAWLTTWTFGLGLLLGMLIGTAVGIVMGRYAPVGKFFASWVRVLYSIPVIALFPLFILWLGLGVNMRLAAIFLGAVLPAIISAEAGVQNVDRTLIEAAKSFGATEWELFRKIILPATVPWIATGFKIAIGRTIVTTVGVELLTSQDGLGGRMSYYSNQLLTAYYMAPLVAVAVISLATYVLGDAIERHFSRWRPID